MGKIVANTQMPRALPSLRRDCVSDGERTVIMPSSGIQLQPNVHLTKGELRQFSFYGYLRSYIGGRTTIHQWQYYY